MAEPLRKIYPLLGEPGIQRDGTVFDTRAWTDGKWARFYKGRPKKMGGYRMMTDQFASLARTCVMFSRNGEHFIASGSANKVEQNVFDMNGWPTNTVADRTPVGFVTNANNLWQFAHMWDAGSTAVRLIAHAAPNLTNIDNTTTASVYIGNATVTTALTAITSSACSGGIAILPPYLFYFGSDGFIGWSVANQPTDVTGVGSGSQRVTEGKILRGMPIRAGAGNKPSGIFWATSALLRCDFIGGTPIFDFDEVSGDGYSILSSSGPVELDGIYYWPGVDRFLMYNGVVREIPNTRNQDYFFTNINMNYRQKTWGIKMPRWGEIWWFFVNKLTDPSATECNHAIIYNKNTGEWYDTPVRRISGVSSQVFPYPIMFDDTDSSSKTRLFMHEFGTDEVIAGQTNAIESYVYSPIMALPAEGPMGEGLIGEDRNTLVQRIEPDVSAVGDVTFSVYGRQFAMSSESLLSNHSLASLSGNDKFFQVGNQARMLRIKVGSNVQGGSFILGKSLMLLQVGDGRPVG